MREIILASTSPRRKQLMQYLFSDNFKIMSPDYEEDNELPVKAEELVRIHADGKASSVAGKLKSGIVIGADTIVVSGTKVLGKPANMEDATRILRAQSGKTTKVISGICVIDIENKRKITEVVVTEVKMKKLGDEDIDKYICTGEPDGRSGAFAIEGIGGVFVERVDGCFFNVVGLPIYTLNSILIKLGIDVFKYRNKSSC
jgi:septum formation protein